MKDKRKKFFTLLMFAIFIISLIFVAVVDAYVLLAASFTVLFALAFRRYLK